MLHAPIPDVKREVLAMVKLVQAYPLFEQVFQAGVMLEAENLILVPGTDSIDQWVVQMRGQLAKSPAIIIAPLRTCKDHLLGACAWEIQVAA
eukprot:scaffold374_cov380-Prasinococcus_capsulatus_cf.AAC.10